MKNLLFYIRIRVGRWINWSNRRRRRIQTLSSPALAFEVIHHNLFVLLSTFSFHVTLVDECDRLWVVDSGVTDILGMPAKVKSPSVLVFDLKNDVLIRQFEIPEEQIKPDSFFVNIVSMSRNLSEFFRRRNRCVELSREDSNPKVSVCLRSLHVPLINAILLTTLVCRCGARKVRRTVRLHSRYLRLRNHRARL